MSAITPHYRSVQQLLQSQSFSIDEYQREYKWEKENIDELLSDLHDEPQLDQWQQHHAGGDQQEHVSRVCALRGSRARRPRAVRR